MTMSSFVDRRREAAEIKRLLGAHRLVTLTGTGGVGKTRLALHLLPRLAGGYAEGARVVQLAGVHEESVVPLAVIEALAIRDTSGREPDQVLVDHLRDQDLLLVLDNCEHLVAASARLAQSLLEETARVRLLATSRQRLGLEAEHVLQVQPLRAPRPGEPLPAKPTLEYPALALFADRAATALTGFALTADNQDAVAALCHQLDGLPLAIELAAVRLRTLGVQQLLERLDRRCRLLADEHDAQPRHRTLQAAVDWSHELCTEQEQAAWARASVFVGDFDLDAAEEVCRGPRLDRDEVSEALAGLVDKSLLVREGDAVRARFRMLESVRHYGLDRLRENGLGEEAARRRMRDWCLALVQDCERDWFGPDQLRIAQRLRAELGNIRSALEFCLSTPGELQAGLWLAGRLWFFWYGCGTWIEGGFWLKRLLEAAPEQTPARARALWVMGLMAGLQGDHTSLLRLSEESHDLARRLGEATEARHTFFARCSAYLVRGDFAQSRAVCEEALSGPPLEGESMSLVGFKYLGLAFSLAHQGEFDRAIALCEEFRRVCLAHGERWMHSYVLRNLSFAEWSKGDRVSAGVHARECLQLKQAVGDLLGTGIALELLAAVHAQDGEGRRAAVLLGASERIWQDTRSPLSRSQAHGPVRSEAEARARALLGEVAFTSAYRKGLGLSFDDAVSYALGESATDRGRSSLDPRLTRREAEVAELVAQGLTNQQIADRLVLARRTAEGHVERILFKLGFTSRSQLAVWADAGRAEHV